MSDVVEVAAAAAAAAAAEDEEDFPAKGTSGSDLPMVAFQSNYDIAYQLGLLDTLTLVYQRQKCDSGSTADLLLSPSTAYRRTKRKLERWIPSSLSLAVTIKQQQQQSSSSSSGAATSADRTRAATLSQRSIEETLHTAGSLSDFAVIPVSGHHHNYSAAAAKEDLTTYTWVPTAIYNITGNHVNSADPTVSSDKLTTADASAAAAAAPHSTFASLDEAIEAGRYFMYNMAQKVCQCATIGERKQLKLVAQKYAQQQPVVDDVVASKKTPSLLHMEFIPRPPSTAAVNISGDNNRRSNSSGGSSGSDIAIIYYHYYHINSSSGNESFSTSSLLLPLLPLWDLTKIYINLVLALNRLLLISSSSGGSSASSESVAVLHHIGSYTLRAPRRNLWEIGACQRRHHCCYRYCSSPSCCRWVRGDPSLSSSSSSSDKRRRSVISSSSSSSNNNNNLRDDDAAVTITTNSHPNSVAALLTVVVYFVVIVPHELRGAFLREFGEVAAAAADRKCDDAESSRNKINKIYRGGGSDNNNNSSSNSSNSKKLAEVLLSPNIFLYNK